MVTAADGEEIQVRLRGTNAPEQGECHHRDSLDHLIELVEDRQVGLTGRDTDQFGRTLAHVWVEASNINIAMVGDGYAIAMTPEGDDPLGKQILEVEEKAAELGLGLWSPQACGGFEPLPDLAIEVIEHDPPGRDEEALADEYVVVSNRGDIEVDLTGWVLRDESSRHRYHFDARARLDPGDRIVITSAETAWSPGGSPVWNNDGDMAILLDDLGRIVDASRY